MNNFDFDFATSEDCLKPESYSLDSVYIVYSDPQYDVRMGKISLDRFCLFRTIKGEGRVVMQNQEEYILNSGDILITDVNKLKRYHCSGDKWDFCWYRFKSKSELPTNVILNLPVDSGEMELTSKCIQLLREESKEAHQMASTTFTYLVQDWLYRWKGSVRKKHIHEDNVKQAIELMRNNIIRSYSIWELAKKVSLSERQFRTVFEEVTGQAPKWYYNDIKIKRGAEMLKTTSMTVNEISYQTGFSSPFHFSKVFKQYIGISPKEYRNT